IAHAGQGAKGGFVLNDGMKHRNVPDRFADHLLAGPAQQTDKTRIHLDDVPGLGIKQHHRVMGGGKPLLMQLPIAEFALLHLADINEGNDSAVDLLVLRLVGAEGHRIPLVYTYLHLELNWCERLDDVENEMLEIRHLHCQPQVREGPSDVDGQQVQEGAPCWREATNTQLPIHHQNRDVDHRVQVRKIVTQLRKREITVL